ncbi:hypothetical protein F5887DRAFT_978521 [Amanita rubescens]|nr:hypothetical protein F5887DRAFT_978521 [Amanita rubescens]
MPRQRKLACALTGLLCLIIYFIPSTTRKHIYLSNGLLQVNPDAPHPIYELIQINKATWANRLAHASQTLPQAIAEYKRRYGRPPPKGFDKWFHWAKSHGVQLLDDYDSIIKGLEPFWGISPSDFKNTQGKQERTTDTFTIAKNASFNPTYLARTSFSDPETWQQRALLRGLDEILALLEPVDDQLPNFRLIFSPHDNPNLLTNYEIRQAYARPYHSLDTPIDRSVRPSPRIHPKTFIHTHLPAMDPCTHPHLFHHHGQYTAHDIAPFPLQPHLALQFAYCTTPLFHDITPPSFVAWVEDSYPRQNDLPWDEKIDERIFWRGSNTGMNFGETTRWRWSQRPRLVNITNQLEGFESVLLPTSLDPRKRRKTAAMTDISFTGFPIGCEPGYCNYLSTQFPFLAKHDSGGLDAGKHKYFVDVDGHGWSSSNALVFKATVYPEWWLDRIQPWVHYVPIQVDYSDLYDALVFFRGGFDTGRVKEDSPDGEDELAKEIASAGREWSRTFWRKEDMTAYFWRLILEIARLSGERDGRDDFNA